VVVVHEGKTESMKSTLSPRGLWAEFEGNDFQEAALVARTQAARIKKSTKRTCKDKRGG